MVDTSQSVSTIGPVRTEGMSVFFRMMAGAVGGAAGTVVLFMGILLGGSIIGSFESLKDAGEDAIGLSPLAVFFILVVLLFASLAASGVGSFLIGLTDTDKYVRIPQGLMQILIVNVVIFILIIPVYFVVKSYEPVYVLFVAALHFLFSSLSSGIVFEIMATERRQVLLGVYSVIVSIFSGLLLLVVVALISDEFTLFLSIPVVLWFSIGFVGGLVEFFYYQTYQRSGIDFLSVGTSYEDTVAMEEEHRALNELRS